MGGYYEDPGFENRRFGLVLRAIASKGLRPRENTPRCTTDVAHIVLLPLLHKVLLAAF